MSRQWAKGSGVFPKTKANLTRSFGSIKLIEFANCDVEGAIILEGFVSISLTSLLTAGYVRETLKLPLIGVITSPEFPPRCIVENGVPHHSVRIFGNRKMCVVLCEFKIPTAQLTAYIVEAILDFADRHKAALVLAVEGLPMDKFDDEKEGKKYDGKLAFVSTSETFSEAMLQLGHEPLLDSVIVGVTGLILAEGLLTNSHVACLIAPTSAQFPDAFSSVHIIKAINAWLPELDISTKSLEEKAALLSASVKKLQSTDADQALSSMSMYS